MTTKEESAEPPKKTEQLAQEQELNELGIPPPPPGKTGLVYIERIPPYMKAHKLRYILNNFGPVRRMYLRREPMWRYKQRLEKGGRKGRLYTDGWAEFQYKVDAKNAALKMNGNTTGLKGRWQYDIWSVKYLHGFKWVHLERALEAERQKSTQIVRDETEKAKETAKKWLKQTKSSIAGNGSGIPRAPRPQEHNSESNSSDELTDEGSEDGELFEEPQQN